MTDQKRYPCPYCRNGLVTETADGGGATDGEFQYQRKCSECDGTGERVVTIIEVDGQAARVVGSSPLSPKSRDALEAVVTAAYKLLEAPR